jgi:hypothetical protein
MSPDWQGRGVRLAFFGRSIMETLVPFDRRIGW